MSLPIEESQPYGASKPDLDIALVELAQAGDAHAFEQLFARYHQQISLYLIRMVGNEATGYELTQDTFLKAWQSLPELQQTTRFVGWLYRIATNLARDQQRRASLVRWLPWESEAWRPQREALSQAGPERQLEENELLATALAGVTLKYRACLILYIIEELPQKQIAERLNIKASYVSNYVRRGLDELRTAYRHLTGEQES